jgi:hypothetical protein
MCRSSSAFFLAMDMDVGRQGHMSLAAMAEEVTAGELEMAPGGLPGTWPGGVACQTAGAALEVRLRRRSVSG